MGKPPVKDIDVRKSDRTTQASSEMMLNKQRVVGINREISCTKSFGKPPCESENLEKTSALKVDAVETCEETEAIYQEDSLLDEIIEEDKAAVVEESRVAK